MGDSGCLNGDLSPTTNGDSGIGLAAHQPTASRAIKELEVCIDSQLNLFIVLCFVIMQLMKINIYADNESLSVHI